MLHESLNVNELIFSWKRKKGVVYFLLLNMKESMCHAVTAKRYYDWNSLILNAFGSALYNV